MIKRLVSFACCLLPLGAGAVVVNPEIGNTFVSTESDAWLDAMAAGNTIEIAASNEFPSIDGIVSQNGFSVTENLYYGVPYQGSQSGNLYILSSVGDTFTIESQGDVSIGAMLQVVDGNTLSFKLGDVADLDVGNGGIQVGNTEKSAALLLQNIDALTVDGAVTLYGNLSVGANSVDVGAIDVNTGNLSVDSAGAVGFDGLVVNGTGVTEVSGAVIASNGTIQNNAGNMVITADTDIDVVGGMANNAAAELVVSGADLNVSGALTNTVAGGKMLLDVKNMTISGTGAQYSLLNSGDFYATVSGETNFANGVNLAGMKADNVFHLKTGTLLGSNLEQLFSNYSNDFQLAVTAGDVSAGQIQNGIGAGDTVNANADMSLSALNVVADSITNSGDKLSVIAGGENADADDGNVTVNGVIVGKSGATTVSAMGVLTATGGVSNQATMVLNGNNVALVDVTNTGETANLTVSSLTAPTGKVTISGALTNTDGQTTVWAKDVSVGGAVINNSGTTTIRGSDTDGGAVQIGAINALGGVVNLNALAGAASVNGAVAVTGGALNLGDSLKTLTVGGAVQVSGDVVASASPTNAAGDMNVTVKGNPFVLTASSVTVGGNVDLTEADATRSVQFDTELTKVVGNVYVANMGRLTLGDAVNAGVAEIGGDLLVNDAGVFESFVSEVSAANISGNGLFKLHGQSLVATNGDINVDGNLYFDPSADPVSISAGIVVRDVNTLNMSANDIDVGAISVGSVNTLDMTASENVMVNGTIVNNGIVNIDAADAVSVSDLVTNKDDMTISGADVNLADVTNTSRLVVVSDNSAVFGGVSTSGDLFDVTAGTSITADDISQSAGVMNLSSYTLSADSVTVNDTSVANLDVSNVNVTGNVSVSGDFVQWGDSGMLNHSADVFSANNLVVGGDFNIDAADTLYSIGTALRVNGAINTAVGASATINAGSTITATSLTNNADLTLSAKNGINLGNLTINADTLMLDSQKGVVSLDTLAMNGGNVVFSGVGLDLTTALNTDGILYQGNSSRLDNKDINVISANYVINTSNLNVGGISQNGTLVINSSDIDVGGSINATDLRFVAVPVDNWMNVNVNGSVSGNVDFIGLEKMTVSGDYVFNGGSNINAVILPYAAGSTIDSTDVNYWSRVLLDEEGMVKIENATDGAAMINVAGKFTAGQNATSLQANSDATPLAGGQIGISLRDIVDQGTAIWFLHANGGVVDATALNKVRNLEVRYCNADGSLCYDYLDSLNVDNGTGDDAPAYIAARDNDMYIVFDPRFGGPIEVFGLQPIVADYQLNTRGEIVSAGALDNMIAGRLKDKKFLNRTPIEVIPLVFRGTNMQQMANELYNRMEYYKETNRDAGMFANFARLFQPREMEQIAGSIALNEHTAFRSFEDRMFDEFIWNRNRNLKKAWLDVDYGMLYQNVQDGKHTDGNRFSISGGFDWQESNTLQLGLTGRVARTSSKVSDKMDLGYIPGESINGHVDIEVADTNLAFGGYLMKTVNEKVRLYGNAFVDLHVLDVNRSQNYVDTIDGDGAAFSLISEWGIMHDILNQYIVGNLYARAGYNFGFNVKEKVDDHDYMRMKSDGYLMLTPGYSLTAQKRIYPSAWFQIRPYASVGIEYDVLGAPNNAKYKFAAADVYTKYNVEIEPFWANIGGGIEMLSANGLQFGIDYRYQYNHDIQLHNIRVSGSYRF